MSGWFSQLRGCFGSGHDLGTIGLSPVSGSLLSQESASPFASAPPPPMLDLSLSLSLSLSNKYNERKKKKEEKKRREVSSTTLWRHYIKAEPSLPAITAEAPSM